MQLVLENAFSIIIPSLFCYIIIFSNNLLFKIRQKILEAKKQLVCSASFFLCASFQAMISVTSFLHEIFLKRIHVRWRDKIALMFN